MAAATIMWRTALTSFSDPLRLQADPGEGNRPLEIELAIYFANANEKLRGFIATSHANHCFFVSSGNFYRESA
jgi:hypothetical protein